MDFKVLLTEILQTKSMYKTFVHPGFALDGR